MKWLNWLRRPKQSPTTRTLQKNDTSHDLNTLVAIATTSSATAMARSEVATHPLTTLIEPQDALLRFARDYLVASGAKVRVEADDLLTATRLDGSSIRYTTSLLRARNEVETELLVQGGAALAELLDDCANQSRAVALRLWETGEPLGLAKAAIARPLSTCTNCLSSAKDALPRCEQCPLRTGQAIIAGFGLVTHAQEQRRWESQSVELTFHVISTDRRGRHDEWKRIAFDMASGREIALLPLDSLLRMEAATDRTLDDPALDESIGHGQALIAPAASALAAFLRLRSAEDYQRRCDDILITHDRLMREDAEATESVHEALQRELAHLAETYAVAVDVQLDSLAVITSPMAEVLLQDKTGNNMTVTVDLGRSGALPFICDLCGKAVPAGRRCSEGHIVCTACLSSQRTAAESCPICTGIKATHPPFLQRVPQSGKLSQVTGLQIGHLKAMTGETWQMCVAWLLERQGYHCERVEARGDALGFFGQNDDQPFAAYALRLPDGVPIGPVELEAAAALRKDMPTGQILLVSTAPADQAICKTAERLNISLLEYDALQQLLQQLEAAHILEMAAEEQAAMERATQAEATRVHILAELEALENALVRASNTHKAPSRAAMVEAVESISGAATIAIQAFVAWDTLAADWQESFGEREARDGSLAILADATALIAMAERAGHLGRVTQQAFAQLQATPNAGELGYTAWRKAVLEELLARCEALRWRIVAIIPSAWHSFALSHDNMALQKAEEATAAATYARGRAEKALAQLQTRARIAITS